MSLWENDTSIIKLIYLISYRRRNKYEVWIIDNLKVLYYDDISYMIKYVQEKFNLTDISELYIGV